MSSIVPSSLLPSLSPRSGGVEEINKQMLDLSKDLDKFAPEHRNQVMVDRLRQQKLRAMISLAKAQHYLAETDVLIADYNLQAVADEFEHMKKERCNNSDMRHPQNLGMKEEKLVLSTDFAASSTHPKDVFCCTSVLPAVGHSKSKEKGTELTSKLSTELAEARRSKTDAYTPTPEYIQPTNEIDGPEPTTKHTKASSKTYEATTSKAYKESSSKTKESATSKTYEASSKNKDATTSKTRRESSSKTKDATTPKTYKESSSSSKTKEPTTSKTYEAATSTKEAAADTDVPAPELKSKKRKRSKSKSKESKRHKSSHKHASSSHATAASSNAPAESTRAPAASSTVNTASQGPIASVNAPSVSSNENLALLGSTASSHVHALHVPNCDCLKSKTTYKVKTLLNTSISPIKRIVEAKGVQTDRKPSKNDIAQTDGVKTLTKAVQTDNVIIFQVGSQTVREKSPDITDEETLLLDTLPAPHSHSTAVSLAKALQQIKSQKSVLEHVCPTEPDVSQMLSQNDVLQKFEVILEDEAETKECPAAVKMEAPDRDLPSTSTEFLVNNLYKDIMKAKEQETRKEMKLKEKVTKRGLWKILDKC